jgi:hypothetical protein
MFLRNVGIYLWVHTTLQSRRPTLTKVNLLVNQNLFSWSILLHSTNPLLAVKYRPSFMEVRMRTFVTDARDWRCTRFMLQFYEFYMVVKDELLLWRKNTECLCLRTKCWQHLDVREEQQESVENTQKERYNLCPSPNVVWTINSIRRTCYNSTISVLSLICR